MNVDLLHAPRTLLLDVNVNGRPVAGVHRFTLTPPHRMTAERRVLEKIGIAVLGDVEPTAAVDLDTLTGVTTRFDEDRQVIAFTVPEERQIRRTYEGRDTAKQVIAPVPDWGGLLNYSLFAAEGKGTSWLQFSGASASLDARIFGPYGALDSGQTIGTTLGSSATNVRLDTSYTFSDQGKLLTGRLGDTITSGLAWTRPVRLAGVQIQRDFSLQPALVTQPLPTFAGSAAVPSTVDVFVDSARIMSQRVDAGPYQLANIPSLTNGTGNVIVTDTSGRQTASSLPLYNVAHLLRPDLTNFSLEAGFVRRNFGLYSDDYDERPVLSTTYGTGLTPLLTFEGHAEAGAGVGNVGTGLAVGTHWGTLEGALTASSEAGKAGGQVYGAYDVQIWSDVSIHASDQARTNAYDDLAGATARWTRAGLSLGTLAGASGIAGSLVDLSSYKPPRHLLDLSVAAPVPVIDGVANLGIVDLEDNSHDRERLVSTSYSRPLPCQATLFTTAFIDLSGHDGGILAGITIPFGTSASASVAGGGSGAGENISFAAQKPLGPEAGSVGWQVADSEGEQASRTGGLSYRSGFGTAAIGATQGGRSLATTGSLEGSIATVGGAIAMGNRVQDSFAIVDAGLPGVGVLQDNRPVGTTDPWGHFLVPTLGAFQANRIAVDPLSLPDRATLDMDEGMVAPVHNSGVHVAFGGKRNAQARTVILVDAAGVPLAPGSRGLVDGSDESFVVGYSGQAYVRRVEPGGGITIQTSSATCHVIVPTGGSAASENHRRTWSCL